jgi:hypothetical protein
METISITVPVEADFWDAMAGDDLETADALLRPALEGVPYAPFNQDEREGDILREHIAKYQSL